MKQLRPIGGVISPTSAVTILITPNQSGIVTERLDQRQDDRNGQHENGDLVHERTEHDVAEQDVT